MTEQTNRQKLSQAIQAALKRARGISTIARPQPSAGDTLIRQLAQQQTEADQANLSEFINHGCKPTKGTRNE